MRILRLAKELGIPYERLLNWCREAGLDYRGPDEEVDPEHVDRARSAFSAFPSGGRASRVPDEEDLESWAADVDLEIEGLPRTLEELDAIERTFQTQSPAPRPKKTREGRIPLDTLLKKFGIEEKNLAKKIRKIIPEDISRLFNHVDLSEEQAGQLQDAIENKVALCCGHPSCREMLEELFGTKKLFITRQPSVCRLCRGSSIRRALEEMAQACKDSGVQRVLVVGGAPSSHKELRNNSPATLEFRLVEGDISRDKQRAAADLQWCDVAVIWAGTILGHEVSQNYMRGKFQGSAPVLVVKRRSIEALAEAVVHHVKRRQG